MEAQAPEEIYPNLKFLDNPEQIAYQNQAEIFPAHIHSEAKNVTSQGLKLHQLELSHPPVFQIQTLRGIIGIRKIYDDNSVERSQLEKCSVKVKTEIN